MPNIARITVLPVGEGRERKAVLSRRWQCDWPQCEPPPCGAPPWSGSMGQFILRVMLLKNRKPFPPTQTDITCRLQQHVAVAHFPPSSCLSLWPVDADVLQVLPARQVAASLSGRERGGRRGGVQRKGSAGRREGGNESSAGNHTPHSQAGQVRGQGS